MFVSCATWGSIFVGNVGEVAQQRKGEAADKAVSPQAVDGGQEDVDLLLGHSRQRQLQSLAGSCVAGCSCAVEGIGRHLRRFFEVGGMARHH